ncbi:GGDEF domain-containing protein [Sphingobium sp. Leaf26]|uniref:GGDEF domain-containing protein n=1 Tax=Sphingobium sp. Leaf26 TaxID=1735693 RepID=UPI0009E93FD3|nr:GGDEF domain-containing protein [Sphingobium sp. Leaf26]
MPNDIDRERRSFLVRYIQIPGKVGSATDGMKSYYREARSALDFLEYHQHEPSPANYDFALRYVMDPASRLAADVNDLTSDGLRLTANAMTTLMQRHAAHDTGKAIDDRERAVARHTEELGTLTSDAHDLTEALGRDVGVIVNQPDHSLINTNNLVMRLSAAERELAELRDEFVTLRNAINVPVQPRSDSGQDELTNALNQTGAWRVLEPLLREGHIYVLIMFIIDDLVSINARFGREVGDNVLNAFAATLRQEFPEEDLIRWNGNEFLIVVTDASSMAARIRADEALAAFAARRLRLRGTGEWIGAVTASAGIVTSRGEEPEVILEIARSSALAAADQGGNRTLG